MSECLAMLPPAPLPLGTAPLFAAINWHTVFFFLFAAAACSCAVAVVLADNVVRMAFYLLLSLGATAGLFFLAGAEFVGAMQLMIYVGGTLVLLVFGVMLTAQAPFVAIKTSSQDRWIAGFVGAALLALLLQSALRVDAWRRPGVGLTGDPTATPLGMAMLGVRVDRDSAGQPALDPQTADRPTADPSLTRVRSGYLLPFEIVSVHLLVVLVGAAYLARAKRRRTPRAVDVAASSTPPETSAREPRRASSSALVPGGRP